MALLSAVSQNLHCRPSFFIGIEEMRRQAQANARAAVDEDFSFGQTFDHLRSVLDINHD